MSQGESRGLKDERTALDLAALAAAARHAEDGEAYQEISRNAAHRIGVVASVYPSHCVYYALEGTFRLFSADATVEPTRLARAASVTRALLDKGYDLAHLDGGWVSCEKILEPAEIAGEAEFLRRLVVDDGGTGEGATPEGTPAPVPFFTRGFFDEVATRLNADPEWRTLAEKFSTRVVVTCVDRNASYLLEVVNGHVVARDATPETVADFRFEAEHAAWIEVMRGQADYYPLVRAHRMKFRGSVLRLRLKMAPLDRMTFAAQRVFQGS